MENIKLGFFEIFTYIIPGFFVLIGISLIIENQNDLIVFVVDKANDMNIPKSILFLVICYILGFKSQFVAYEIFKPLSKWIWPKRMEKETSFSKLESRISQIRHFSPNNFVSLQKWFALRAMCYGMFFALLFLEMILIFRSIEFCFWSHQRIVLLLVFSIFSILFLRRAVTFHEWSHRTIKKSMKHMNEFKNRY
ncbi:hypothetical protein PP182_19945 [Maribacter sp. PR1]|uniref:Glycosyl-4,4'-diaponeurosporenoate acyltransferase n=1 Tax=Maribacter cobaltidurans TaxID=1178778 RepID=A0ABU7J0S2_9FLAO|nr:MULTISPECIES: hypothetical protein [Maribacter]MDC6390969.1 hypothetical protein [Maribacter sp. PR1]MEE1978361.1 hypothetical protein [Maribacter cobaltidurans]